VGGGSGGGRSEERGGADYVQVERGLGQIDALTRRLAAGGSASASEASIGTSSGMVSQLVAKKGFDADKVAAAIQSLTSATTASNIPANAVHSYADEGDETAVQLDRFLAQQHQQVIAHAIDATRRDAQRDARVRCERSMRNHWNNTKKRVFAEIGGASAQGTLLKTPMKHHRPHTPGVGGLVSHHNSILPPTATPQKASSNSAISLQMMPKHRAYATALRTLVASYPKVPSTASTRNTASSIDPFALFADVAARLERTPNTSSAVPSSGHVGKCWRLLSLMFSNQGVAAFDLKKGCRDSGMEGFEGSEDAVRFRRRVVEGGKTFLQEIYWDFIQQVIAQNRIQVGGLPTVHVLVDAYISLKYNKNGTWKTACTAPLETVNNNSVAPWAHLFYLLRCGLHAEALQYATEPNGAFSKVANPSAAAWLKSFLETGALPPKQRAEVQEEWNTRIRPFLGDASSPLKVDPFKAALHKILGRCDLNAAGGTRGIKGAADVAPSVEDYLWLQLMLVREDATGVAERSTLRDMSRAMRAFGEAHFSPGGRAPHVYFLVLLLVGEFERAVAFLYGVGGGDAVAGGGGVGLEAVHFAVALAAQGCLRVPENPRGFEGGAAVDIVAVRAAGVGGEETAYLLLGKLLNGYARLFFKTDPVDAAAYLMVLGYYGGSLGDGAAAAGKVNTAVRDAVVLQAGREYTQLLHSYIKELVLVASKQATVSNNGAALTALLGESASSHDVRVAGDLEKHLGLMHLASYAELVKRVIVPAAQEAEHKGLLADAVKLYDYAQEYDLVVGILCKQLSDAFLIGADAAVQQLAAAANGLATLFGSVSVASPGQGLHRPSAGAMSGVGVPVMDSPAFRGGATRTSASVSAYLSPAGEKTVKEASQVLDHYTRRAAISSRITEARRATAATLLSLHRFLALYAAGTDKSEEGVETLRETRLLPMSTDMAAVMRLVDEFRALDETVAKCVPLLMVMAMDLVVRVFASYRDGAKYGEAMRARKMDECRALGRAVILYAGNIQYRVPSDVFGKLTRLEVMMG
ncbi:Nup93/Nic96-domain-containing protein, partial [Chytriomyces sp. MP71]